MQQAYSPDDRRVNNARGSNSRTPAATCCIAGAGPGGAMLALLLARRRVPVTLLERHADFDRDFRGDTLHASVMEVLEEIGLADRILQLPHSKIRVMRVETVDGALPLVDFSRLRTRYPFITMIPQARFLEFITGEAARCPGFRLVMQARVEELIEEGGVVHGVRYHAPDGVHELRAALTVGADGRFSTVRKLARMEPISTSPPIDVLWFRLPRQETDAHESGAAIARAGRFFVLLDRGGEWQIARIIPKGSFEEIRSAGIETLRQAIAESIPDFAGRVDQLRDWTQISFLSVESSRVQRWYRPGLLLIGDAAHVMSPAGGVGINYAIQDAVEAANVLARPLLENRLNVEHLAEVQRRREWPTRVIQAVQVMFIRRIRAALSRRPQPFRLPLPLRLMVRIPLLRALPGRLIAFGVRSVHVESR